jgi:hypothetical protein
MMPIRFSLRKWWQNDNSFMLSPTIVILNFRNFASLFNETTNTDEC